MKRKSLLTLLIIGFSVIFIALFYCKRYKEETTYWKYLIKSKPFLATIPKKIIKNEPKRFDIFVKQEFKHIIIELPKQLIADKTLKESISYTTQDKSIVIFMMVTEGRITPLKFQNKYKTDFQFFKDVLNTTDISELLSFKSTFVPYVGDNIEIYEFKIGKNQGFLYKGELKEISDYDVFLDNYLVHLKIYDKNYVLSSDEINFTVDSLNSAK